MVPVSVGTCLRWYVSYMVRASVGMCLCRSSEVLHYLHVNLAERIAQHCVDGGRHVHLLVDRKVVHCVCVCVCVCVIVCVCVCVRERESRKSEKLASMFMRTGLFKYGYTTASTNTGMHGDHTRMAIPACTVMSMNPCGTGVCPGAMAASLSATD